MTNEQLEKQLMYYDLPFYFEGGYYVVTCKDNYFIFIQPKRLLFNVYQVINGKDYFCGFSIGLESLLNTFNNIEMGEQLIFD